MSKATRRERLGTVVLTALIVGGVAVPAHAEDPPGSKITAVPDAGARPTAYGESPFLPTGTLAIPATLPITPLEYLRAQIDAATVETQVLSERINELKEQHEAARIALAWAEHEWGLADTVLKEAQSAAAKAATDAYVSANQLPPGFQSGSTLRDFQLLQPPQSETFGESTAYELERADVAEKTAAEKLDQAKLDEKVASENLDIATKAYEQRDKARLLLQERFVTLQSEEERKRERDEGKLIDGYDPGKSNQGLAAHPNAQKAVRYALAQLGKPYKFAEEGPDYFDCSGLTWAAFRTVGIYLPRVSRDQYQAYKAKPVSPSALLPGDLIFYSSDPDNPRTIHHVAMYLGDSKIVHATGSGDRVKISKINLGPSGPIDFAVRVIDAVPAVPTTTQ